MATKLTANNLLYLYGLLTREFGVGTQAFLPRVEEAFAADGIDPIALEYTDAADLLASLDFVTLTAFKGGRVYATVVRRDDFDEALAAAGEQEEAKPALDQLIDVFVVFLSDEENAKYVDTIVISGHTDSTGTDESNRILSTDRANAVLGYLLTGKNGKLNPYARYFCASGYGETRPVQSNATDAGRAANRCIEISVILRDDSVMQIVESYLDIEPPKLPGGN